MTSPLFVYTFLMIVSPVLCINPTLLNILTASPSELLTNNSSIFSLSTSDSTEFETNPTAEPIVDKTNCTGAFSNFSNLVVEFTKCSIDHARPVRLCMSCGRVYNQTVHAYNVLRQQESDCLEYFFRSDQLAIVDIIFNGASSLWKKSFCHNCYENYDQSVSFFNASQEMLNCIESSNTTSTFNPNSTCFRCNAAYTRVSQSYNKFVKQRHEFDGGICMDIVDSMNITHRVWKEYNCVVEFGRTIGSSNVITTLVFGFLPLLFYMLARNVSRIEDVKIVRPKRKFTTIVPPPNHTDPEEEEVESQADRY